MGISPRGNLPNLTVTWSHAPRPRMFVHVRSALGGYGLYGYLVSEEYTEKPKAPVSAIGRAAVYLRDHTGEHRGAGMEYAAILSLLAIPLWWPSRAARFCVVFTAVAWFFMASTKDAGASLHHTVLLWPFPQLLVAIALSALRWRWAAVSVSALLVVLNLLTISQYISQFERNGAENVYTDAIYPLASALTEDPAETIYMLDWGIQIPLDVLHSGKLHMRSGHEPFVTDTPSDWDKDEARRMFADRGGLFITHVGKREIFEGVHKRFRINPPPPPGVRKTRFASFQIPMDVLFLRFSSWPARRRVNLK